MTEIGGTRSNSLFRAFLDGETRGEETLSKNSIDGEKCVMKVIPEHPREVFSFLLLRIGHLVTTTSASS